MLYDDVWWMCCACCDLVLIVFRIITRDPQIDKARLHEVATMWPNQCHLAQKTQGQHRSTYSRKMSNSQFSLFLELLSDHFWLGQLAGSANSWWNLTPKIIPCSSDSCSPACDYLLIPHVIVWYCVTLFLFLWRQKNTAKKCAQFVVLWKIWLVGILVEN